MGTTTTNLALYKPDSTDVVNVQTDINNNMDTIDTAVQDLRVPTKGKLWRTSAFQALTGTGTDVDFEASRLSGGMTAGSGSNGLVVPKSGLYKVSVYGYATGSDLWRAQFTAYRVRSAVADKDITFLGFWKESTFDSAMTADNEVPLAAGDEIRVKASSSSGSGSTWGTDETNGVRLHVEYKGPLNGATPI
jgi:hypothetical protein